MSHRKIFLAAAFCFFVGTGAAHAGTITLDTTANDDPASTGDGKCGLREAIAWANFKNNRGTGPTSDDCKAQATSGSNAIVLKDGEAYALDTFDHATQNNTNDNYTGTPAIETTVTIQGAATIQGNGNNNGSAFRAFEVTGTGDLTLDGVTVQGFRVNDNLGGGVYNQGILTVKNANFFSNQAPTGGCIASEQSKLGTGELNISDSTFRSCRAFTPDNNNNNNNGDGGVGGALTSVGPRAPTTITNTLFESNIANLIGAAVVIGTTGGKTSMVSNSAFLFNILLGTIQNGSSPLCYGGSALVHAQGFGDSTNAGDTISVDRTTFSDNATCLNSLLGGAPILSNGGAITLTHCTITNNDGGGVASTSSKVHVKDTIIAGNFVGGQEGPRSACVGTVISDGHNLIGNDEECQYAKAAGDIIGQADCGAGVKAPIDARLDFMEPADPALPFYQPMQDSPAMGAGSNGSTIGATEVAWNGTTPFDVCASSNVSGTTSGGGSSGSGPSGTPPVSDNPASPPATAPAGGNGTGTTTHTTETPNAGGGGCGGTKGTTTTTTAILTGETHGPAWPIYLVIVTLPPLFYRLRRGAVRVR